MESAFEISPLAHRLIAAGGSGEEIMDYFISEVVPIFQDLGDDDERADLNGAMCTVYTMIGEDANWEALAAVDEMLTFNGFQDHVGLGVDHVVMGAIGANNIDFIREFLVRKHPLEEAENDGNVMDLTFIVFLIKEDALEELLQDIYWIDKRTLFWFATTVALNWSFSHKYNASSIIGMVERAMNLVIQIKCISNSTEHKKAFDMALYKKPFAQTVADAGVEVEITVSPIQADGMRPWTVDLVPTDLEQKLSIAWRFWFDG